MLVYELANFMLFFIVTLWVASMPARTPLLWSTWLAIEVALGVREWNRRGSKADFAPAFAAWRFDWLDVPALLRRDQPACFATLTRGLASPEHAAFVEPLKASRT